MKRKVSHNTYSWLKDVLKGKKKLIFILVILNISVPISQKKSPEHISAFRSMLYLTFVIDSHVINVVNLCL